MSDSGSSPLPARLKKARKQRKISQKNLGIMAGLDEFVASARMNRYEQGVHFPDYPMVCKLAEILDVPVGYFYVDNDETAELLVLISSGERDEAHKQLDLLLDKTSSI